MFAAVYEGIILGLVLAFSFGPGFFALINTGIKHGFKPAASLAVGIFLSDLALVILIFVLLALGAQGILSNPKSQSFIGRFTIFYLVQPNKVQHFQPVKILV